MNTLSHPNPSWQFILLRAAAAILFGLLALLLPGPTLAGLVLLFAAYMLADGVFAIIAGWRAARQREPWGWFALEAVVNIATGAIAVVWPAITLLAFVMLTAAWALVSGGMMLLGALRFPENRGRMWLVLGGVVSLIWGGLLIFWPLAGAVAMTLWLGAYALVLGLTLLFGALKLRREATKPQEHSPGPTANNPS
ncbi:MAG: DUF308 domain-containing protein [Pseudomonadota bacterium]|nr:DUF308 domain-containing protein [Pseudomonadota bacterium]